MNFVDEFKEKILSLKAQDFEAMALEAYRYQYAQNELYREFANFLNRSPAQVKTTDDIPFLPISFFKSHTVKTGNWPSKVVFSSSTTSGQIPSRHHLADVEFYEKVSHLIFNKFYGNLSQWHIFGLLPSYLERSGSSLVFMVESFLKVSRLPGGFFLKDYDRLIGQIRELQGSSQILLIGVSFALWDLAEYKEPNLSGCVVMETGGMKGKRKELVREELHKILCKSFSISEIHSEYGMTELLSQAYARSKGCFELPSWCRVIIRQANDPLSYTSGIGGINFIDLANIESCCFVETSDIGKITQGGFEVLGRLDNSDVRGCNLLF
jgi:hypothetical protein